MLARQERVIKFQFGLIPNALPWRCCCVRSPEPHQCFHVGLQEKDRLGPEEKCLCGLIHEGRIIVAVAVGVSVVKWALAILAFESFIMLTVSRRRFCSVIVGLAEPPCDVDTRFANKTSGLDTQCSVGLGNRLASFVEGKPVQVVRVAPQQSLNGALGSLPGQ